MESESPIVIALQRAISSDDRRALNHLTAQRLVCEVKVRQKKSSAEIKLFQTVGAKPDLIKEVYKFFPNGHINGM